MPAIPGYAHLAQDPGYRSGQPRVAEAGVSVYAIWLFHRAGRSPEEIAEDYAPISLAAVYSALAHATDHLQEMEAYLEADKRDEAENRAKYPPHPKIKEALESASVGLEQSAFLIRR